MVELDRIGQQRRANSAPDNDEGGRNQVGMPVSRVQQCLDSLVERRSIEMQVIVLSCCRCGRRHESARNGPSITDELGSGFVCPAFGGRRHPAVERIQDRNCSRGEPGPPHVAVVTKV